MSKKSVTQEPFSTKHRGLWRDSKERAMNCWVRLEAIISRDKMTQWSLSNLFQGLHRATRQPSSIHVDDIPWRSRDSHRGQIASLLRDKERA